MINCDYALREYGYLKLTDKHNGVYNIIIILAGEKKSKKMELGSILERKQW